MLEVQGALLGLGAGDAGSVVAEAVDDVAVVAVGGTVEFDFCCSRMSTALVSSSLWVLVRSCMVAAAGIGFYFAASWVEIDSEVVAEFASADGFGAELCQPPVQVKW